MEISLSSTLKRNHLLSVLVEEYWRLKKGLVHPFCVLSSTLTPFHLLFLQLIADERLMKGLLHPFCPPLLTPVHLLSGQVLEDCEKI
jgi:hypothetical protein